MQKDKLPTFSANSAVFFTGITLPAVLKSFSDGTDMTTIQRHLHASLRHSLI